MAGAPAYRYQEPARAPRRAPQQSPRIKVVPGKGRQASEGLSPTILAIAKVSAVMLVLFALMGFVRIGLASATVSTAVSSSELSSQIENARSQGNDLEVKQSFLSNPTSIKQQASDLKMAEGEAVSLTLSKDIVSTDGRGNLSLSQSIKALAQG